MIRPVTAHKINDHVLCPIEFHGSPTWWKTGSPESFLGCPNYFGLSKKKTNCFLVMNTKLHRKVLLVQMRLSIMLNSSIHAIVRRLLKTWNRRARGLLNLGEGRARGIRRQNESEWIPVPWNALEILQSYTNPSKWVCQFTCRSCVWSAVCSGWHQISATLPLCVGNPPVTGWFRLDKDLSQRWFETPWRSSDVTVLWGPACACIHIDTQILR